MSRLIDADALKWDIEVAPYNDYDDFLRTERLIDDAPTVEERPKGKWIEHEDEKWGGVWYTCSNCNQNAPYEQDVYNIWRQKLSDYCPNCGADMRGDV